ncbi:CrcB family protein [Nocardioides sp. C4-1]|uniref:fluoride efflux transporter FluC n=1 Tax=Nocardioides sp. C4-1 TaxID=3151851 RepID=UPI00326452FF
MTQQGEPPLRRVLAVVAAGGVLGSAARHALEVAWPTSSGGFPAATFVTNVVGAMLLGALMVVVVERGGAHPLLRPFLGVGVLGGFTTFSTYAVQTTVLVDADHALVGLGYLLLTPVVAVAAVGVGMAAVRRATRGTAR